MLNPLFWIMAFFAWAYFSDNKRRKVLIISGLTLLYVYHTDFLNYYLYKKLEFPMVWYKDVPQNFDAVIVLGGMAAPGRMPNDRTHFAGSPDRLMHALQLFKLGKAKTIILTGGSGELIGEKVPEAQYLKNVLLLSGVPDSAIIVESQSRNTRENATFTKDVTQKQFPLGGKYILVTSAGHMARAIGCFKKVGMDVMPFPVNSEVDSKSQLLGRLIPNVASPLKWNALLHEYLGYLSYKVAGYI